MAEVLTRVDGRTLKLTNLDKPLYRSGFSKGEVIAYYHAIAPVMVPHLTGRAVTRVRFPNGTDAASFFEKNAPAGTPHWVRVVTVTGFHESNTYPVVADTATLIWLANLAAIEVHAHQWRVPAEATAVRLTETTAVDHLVIDLDPGAGVTMPLIASAAILVAGELAADRLTGLPKTSGSKGLQIFVPLRPTPADAVRSYMRTLADRLLAQHPTVFVTGISRQLRDGRILLDINQNLPGRTTICPYSLRGRPEPTVSTPLRWTEVEAAVDGAPLRFDAPNVLARVAEHGDLFAAALAEQRGSLPDAG
ncbi:MAG: non-homologous end-joining DNA ligase [Propioniciclava sp.]